MSKDPGVNLELVIRSCLSAMTPFETLSRMHKRPFTVRSVERHITDDEWLDLSCAINLAQSAIAVLEARTAKSLCTCDPYGACEYCSGGKAVASVADGVEVGQHDLYKTGDRGAPSQILDRNGAVVLDMCRLCGKVESELFAKCVGKTKENKMSMHRIPLTPTEEAGLRAHGLDIGTPSQLSDAFRQGVRWYQNQEHAELSKIRNEFNRVINHAIDLGVETSEFLQCWREGDWEACKEFGFEPGVM